MDKPSSQPKQPESTDSVDAAAAKTKKHMFELSLELERRSNDQSNYDMRLIQFALAYIIRKLYVE